MSLVVATRQNKAIKHTKKSQRVNMSFDASTGGAAADFKLPKIGSATDLVDKNWIDMKDLVEKRGSDYD